MNAKILVINCGSSSLKYEIYDMPERNSLGKGAVERIGESQAIHSQSSPAGEFERTPVVADHQEAVALMLAAVTDSGTGIIDSIEEIVGVGHRVVHGGEKYAESVIIDDDVIQAIEANIELAPLHNPPNLTGIRVLQQHLPGIPQIAVFDTAFHQTMPPAAYLYGLPRELYQKHKIRRYGFHGTSHRFVVNEAMKLMKRSAENTNVISCHLGNGASITAVQNGESRDTSMGLTPLEGLMMGTRSGDLDPYIPLFLLERGYSSEEINAILNKKGGMLGLSGVSNDLRDVEKAAEQGDRNALEALQVYAYRIRKYIGAYAANLFKVDIMVFTGGVGQYNVKMRERICHRLENIGIHMDYNLNQKNGCEKGIISTNYSPTAILVVPTNEELQIAIDTYHLIGE